MKGMSNRLRRAGLQIGPTCLGVLVAVGGNFLYEGLKGPIVPLSISIAVICFFGALIVFFIHFIFIGERELNREDFARSQIRYALRALLVNADASLTAKAGIALNIRFYRHKRVGGSDRLYQDKEIHSLNVMRSTEEPFTFIDINEKNMVMCQSFLTKSHKFSVLDHSQFEDIYSAHAKKAIDPQQKWILAIPVLPVDVDGTISDDARPFGIIAIYSNKALPDEFSDVLDDFIYLALQSSRSFASILSLGRTLNIA